MATPLVTRLRYIKAADPDELTNFLGRLKFRVEIKTVQWDGSAWVCWYIPPDSTDFDQPNVTLD